MTMRTTIAQETKTAAGVRTASVLADADVWPSAFRAALQEEGFTVFTSPELHELFDRSHDGSPDLPILPKPDPRYREGRRRRRRYHSIQRRRRLRRPRPGAAAQGAALADRPERRRHHRPRPGNRPGQVRGGAARTAGAPDADGAAAPRRAGGEGGQGARRPHPALVSPRARLRCARGSEPGEGPHSQPAAKA